MKNLWLRILSIACLFAFPAAAQDLTCDTTGQAWLIDGVADPAPAGDCSDGPWSTALSTFTPVPVGQFPVPLPFNGSQPCAGARNCWGGRPDNFQPPGELATPSDEIRKIISRCHAGAHTEFDTKPADGSCFGHSFLGCWPAGCRAKTARLVVRMQAVRDAGNDTFAIRSGGRQRFSSEIKNLPGAGGQWEEDDEATFFFNLAAMPDGSNILGQISQGVDVVIQDDTKIDYMRLHLTFDCCARACGTKFRDDNCNGRRDRGERSLGGWVVTLSDAQGKARTVTTAADGSYCFDGVQPGSYTVGEQSQTGWVQTAPPAPGRYPLKLKRGDEVENLDFGNRKCDSCGTPPPDPRGACCTRNGCVQTSLEQCQEIGVWSGEPTCTNRTCRGRGGACCTREGCVQTLAAGCCNLDGLWRPNTTCQQVDCATADPFGACVVGDSCRQTTFCDCREAGGKWLPSTSCDALP